MKAAGERADGAADRHERAKDYLGEGEIAALLDAAKAGTARHARPSAAAHDGARRASPGPASR
jgi:hypothetical protein